MKKLLRFLPIMLIAVIGISLSACGDNDEPIAPTELPTAAKTFLTTYYKSVEIVSTTKDKNEYKVTLANGHEVDFNTRGEWTDVDAPAGQTIPSGFYPAEIDSYIETVFNGDGINEISKVIKGYEVELVTGTELIFSSDGSFISFDPD